MAKMTSSEYKKRVKKEALLADWCVARYDATENWAWRPLILSQHITEPTTIHSKGNKKPDALALSFDLEDPANIDALFTYINLSGGWLTILDKDEKVYKKISFDAISKKAETVQQFST